MSVTEQGKNPVTQVGNPDAGNSDGVRDQGQEGFQPVDSDGAPVQSTDVDSGTGQKFTGTHMEPDEQTIVDPKDGKPNDALGRTDSDQPEPGKPAKTVKADGPAVPGNYGRNQRDQIYKNASKEREVQVTDEDSPGHNYIEQLEAEAAGGTVDAPADGGEGGADPETLAAAKLIKQEQEGAEGEVETQPGDQSADTSGVDTKEKHYYIKVDGGQQIASATQIRDAGGIDALQKSRSADNKFNDLATERRRFDAEKADFDNEVETQVRKLVRETLNQVPSQGDVPGTDRGTAGRETGVKADEVAQAIYDGNTDDAGEQLRKLIRQELGTTTSDSTVASGNAREDELVAKVVASLDPPGSQKEQPSAVRSKEQVRANTVYRENFPDLVAAAEERPEIIQRAGAEMARRSVDPANTGRTLAELALEVGNELRTLYMPPEGVSLQDVLSAEDAKAVVVSKRRLRGTQTSAAASAHKPDASQDQSQPYGQKHQSAFDQIKKSRGQTA